jgi:glycosyltransferase involved in cell wall biosynthesis
MHQTKDYGMNDKKIKVSVLVTFYNQAQYVDRALASVMNQIRDFDIEVLIGDNCSTDNTIELVNKWIEKYPDIIFLYRKERGKLSVHNVSANRLNLLKHVKGEYFLILDGDDYFCDNRKLSIQAGILDKLENSDCIACTHAMKIVHSDGSEESEPVKGLEEGKLTLEEYWAKYYFHPENTLIRSSVIPQLPLEKMRYCFDDNCITFAVLQHGKLYYLPRCMVVYSDDGEGLWRTEKKVINIVRCMAYYDQINFINPAYKKITTKRTAQYWREIISVRKEINSADFAGYEQEIRENNLVWFDRWVHYNEQPKLMQLYMLIVAYHKSWKFVFRCKGGHIYHKYIKRDRK